MITCNSSGLRFKSFVKLFSILTLALSIISCGGGGGSASNDTSATTKTTITPFKGKYSSGNVTIKDAKGNQVALLNGSGTIDATGSASVIFSKDVSYPLTVSVTGTYINEVTGTTTTTNVPLRSVIPDENTTTQAIPVTAITEIAASILDKNATDGKTITTFLAKKTISTVASAVLGQSYEQAMTAPVFEADGKTTSQETIKLAALAIAADSADNNGTDLAAKIKNIGDAIASGKSPSVVIQQKFYEDALNLVNGGSKSILKNGSNISIITPNPISQDVIKIEDDLITSLLLLWDSNTSFWDNSNWN